MRALDRKLLRDVRQIWTQAFTLAVVVGSAVAGFITTYSAQDSLSWSRDRYYAQSQFADVFIDLKRAPLSLVPRLQSTVGVAHVETSITLLAQIDIPGISDPITGRMIGIKPDATPELNRIFLRSGKMIAPYQTGTIDVLVSEAFASARGLQPGAVLYALLNGKRQALRISGIALSPEYIFAGLIGAPDVKGFGVFWMDEKKLAKASNMEGAFNHVAARLTPGSNQTRVIDELDQIIAPYGSTRAYGRDEQMSHKVLNSEIQEQRVLGTVLPLIFLAIAAFLLNVVIGRQITLQREQIAALKALGYTNLSIANHYLKLVTLIVMSGVVLGIILGYWLGNELTGMYQQVFHFPQFYYRVRSELLLTALTVTMLAGAASAWYAIRSSVRLSPAQAMRPPAPGTYKKSSAEPLVRYLGWASSTRMIIRNMNRHPWRFALTVVGIAASVAVLISGLFWRDSIAKMIDVQFSHALRGDLSVYLIDPRPATILHEFMHLPEVTGTEVARTVNARLSHDQHEWRGLVQGKPAHPLLHRIIDVDMHAHTPPTDSVLITDRLADRLHVHPGDKIKVEIQEGKRLTFDLIVGGTIQEMMGMNAYIERRSLNHHLHEGDVVNHITLAIAKEHEPSLLSNLKQYPLVALAISKNILLANIESITARNLLITSTVLTLFASVITVGVVYNQARISLTEREWEFASLRVLGFTRKEVSTLLLGELGIAITLAIPLGLLAGYWLALGIVNMIKTDEFYFSLVILPSTYATASLCVFFSATASALVVNRHIANLDLVGVLKTRD